LADLKEEAFLVVCADIHPRVTNIKLQAKQHDH
jgi:hypothetical protein